MWGHSTPQSSTGGEGGRRFFPHTVSSSSSLASGGEGGRELPEVLSALAREGVVLHGRPGSGKTYLARTVQERLKTAGYEMVVWCNFAQVMEGLSGRCSQRELAELVGKEAGLNHSDQQRLVQLLMQGSDKVALIIDDIYGRGIEDCVRSRIDREKPELLEGFLSETAGQVRSETRIEKHEYSLEQIQVGGSNEEPNSNALVGKYEMLVREKVEMVEQLLRGPGARLLVGRLPHPDICPHKVELGGFDGLPTTIEYMKLRLATVYKTTVIQPLESYLSAHPLISSLCSVPRFANALCTAYSRDNKSIRDTESVLVHKMLLEWVKEELPKLQENSLYKLPQQERNDFLHISRIAFESLTRSAGASDDGRFSLLDNSEVNAVNLQEGYASLDDARSFGLILSSGNALYSFVHSIIQEFMAAFYVSSLPQDQQILFYTDIFPKHARCFLHVAHFHFGMTKLETKEFLNPSRMVLSAMIESVAHFVEKTREELKKEEGKQEKNEEKQKKMKEVLLELQKLMVGCLYEAQDPTLVKNFTQQYTPLMEMSFPDVRALDDARFTTQLVYVILQSGIEKWEIVVPNEHALGKTDAVKFPVSIAAGIAVSIDVQVQRSQSLSFSMRAKFEPSTPQKTGRATEMMKRATNEQEREMYFKLAMLCTGQRETLHRVTQLYSPVPVRSDAADPAYASLITCGCAGKTLATKVVFEPIHPIHTVQLGPRSRKARAAEAERDATTKAHMQQQHQNNYTEVIILNKPSVKSVTFEPPGGGAQCRLVMTGDTSPMASGRIAMESEQMLEDSVNWMKCLAVSDADEAKMAMVAHGLPLPKKSKIEGDKGNVVQPGEVSGTRFHDDKARQPTTAAAQVPPTHKHFLEPDVLPYSPTPTQAETSEKVTWRAGMVMHSTIPDVFQKLKTYSVPEEDKPIRRGGNGQLFETEYFGYSMVAKKTLFRNREYNIILRLNHGNIVPLLAVMVGEVFHKRRFYCYHMLPRMSGDVARMISDYPDYTLASLKEANSDDPRRFGLALGNMRYLLAEVLRGLAYMHGLHILHRDVKASNILVKFHCQHTNLLWCTCTNKFKVCVCDFDAAVEMDENDGMVPISTTNNKMFYLPPVGTQGFRSPECSQLVIASHSDIIAPQLTPKTDIWSFGVLIMRLFLGEDGPASQRQNSILLLSYHGAKGMTEGRHRIKTEDSEMRQLVSDNEVERILKFPRLRARLSGVRNLVDFVTGCLQVDPERRPSAKDLLEHKFLY